MTKPQLMEELKQIENEIREFIAWNILGEMPGTNPSCINHSCVEQGWLLTRNYITGEHDIACEALDTIDPVFPVAGTPLVVHVKSRIHGNRGMTKPQLMGELKKIEKVIRKIIAWNMLRATPRTNPTCLSHPRVERGWQLTRDYIIRKHYKSCKAKKTLPLVPVFPVNGTPLIDYVTKTYIRVEYTKVEYNTYASEVCRYCSKLGAADSFCGNAWEKCGEQNGKTGLPLWWQDGRDLSKQPFAWLYRDCHRDPDRRKAQEIAIDPDWINQMPLSSGQLPTEQTAPERLSSNLAWIRTWILETAQQQSPREQMIAALTLSVLWDVDLRSRGNFCLNVDSEKATQIAIFVDSAINDVPTGALPSKSSIHAWINSIPKAKRVKYYLDQGKPVKAAGMTGLILKTFWKCSFQEIASALRKKQNSIGPLLTKAVRTLMNQ